MKPLGSFDLAPYHRDLLLCLPFREGAGTRTQDWAKPYHPMIFGTTPTWTTLDNGLAVLDFTSPDQLQCAGADSADLDFTSEDFSLAAWAYHDNLSSAHVLFNRGTVNTCGWEWYTAVGNLALRTNQAASREGVSGMGCVALNTWQFLLTTRSGLVAKMYANGEQVVATSTDNGLLDPIACEAQTFLVANNPNSNGFDGMLWNLRIWRRALSASEVKGIFEAERDLFGV